MEDDSVMVTAFAIRTLTICHQELAKHPAKAPVNGSATPEKKTE
jgi:hypothetical protein